MYSLDQTGKTNNHRDRTQRDETDTGHDQGDKKRMCMSLYP